MLVSQNFAEALAAAEREISANGPIDFAGTALLLRLARPFALKGEPGARELISVIDQVRTDGRVTEGDAARLDGLIRKLAAREPLTLADYVREIEDFPKPGVLFRDVTGILDNPFGFRLAIDELEAAVADTDFDLVAAPESRGFIFGAALADRLGKAFVPVRKPGKLPRRTVSEKYALEYGTAELHIHADAIWPGERVVIVDDLLATGGTAAAAARLVEKLGGKVAKMLFPIELEGFAARTGLLAPYDVATLVRYPGK